MKVAVDPWVCQGHLNCTVIAPDVFVYDEEASHTVALDRAVPVGLEGAARAAVAACPERAISVVDAPA